MSHVASCMTPMSGSDECQWHRGPRQTHPSHCFISFHECNVLKTMINMVKVYWRLTCA